MRLTNMVVLTAGSLLALSACRQTTSTNGNITSNASGNASAGATTGAASIDGTWKTDLSTLQLQTKPDQLLILAGQFSCPTCTPPLAVPADGLMHPVNRPYADHVSIKVVDDRTVTRTDQKNAKTTGTTQYSVSPDGNRLTITFEDDTGSKPVKGSVTEARVAPVPAGAHKISGSWQPQKYNNVSDEGLTVTFQLEDSTLRMTAPTGQSYKAKLDGTETPIKGDMAGTTASVTKSGDSFIETDKRGGKVVSVTTMTPGSDGKLHVTSKDKENGSSATFAMNKQ